VTRRGKRILLVTAALVALAAAGAGGLAAYAYHYLSVVRYTADRGHVRVDARSVQGRGTVLVPDRGYPLYMFPPDDHARVSCVGDCATGWPPLTVPPGGRVVAGDGVDANLLGSVRDPSGHAWSPTMAGRCTPTSATTGRYAPPGRASTPTAATGT
jgi:predicted lipoprotein with Yx(FWY)xxD motif